MLNKTNSRLVFSGVYIIYLVEIKRRDEVGKPDVLAKKGRAAAYCSLATAWVRANGHKAWTHLFILDDEVKANRTLDDYVKTFSQK